MQLFVKRGDDVWWECGFYEGSEECIVRGEQCGERKLAYAARLEIMV